MTSISQNSGIVQGVKMSIGKFGLRATFKGHGIRGNHLEGVRRGVIRGWSRASVRRLRDTLWSKSIPDSVIVGVTLTVPWKEENFKVCDEFKSALNRLALMFKRRFPSSAFVYRVELQKRGMPHLHAIVYFATSDYGSVSSAKDWFTLQWWKSFKDVHGGSVEDYFKHGVDCKPLDDSPLRLMRYLCDHASKRKQEQMGWKGRQWGVIGSSRLSSLPEIRLPDFPTARSEGYFWRLLGRVCSYWQKGNFPFGLRCRPSTRKWGVSFVPGGGDTVRRIYEAALAH